MIGELQIVKHVEGSGSDLFLKSFTGICLEGLRKTTKNLSQNSRFQAKIWTWPPGVRRSVHHLTSTPVPVFMCQVIKVMACWNDELEMMRPMERLKKNTDCHNVYIAIMIANYKSLMKWSCPVLMFNKNNRHTTITVNKQI
jgi:hypothetical protein